MALQSLHSYSDVTVAVTSLFFYKKFYEKFHYLLDIERL